MSEGPLATLDDLERFKRALKAGQAVRAEWPLWCWLCDRPLMVALGQAPLHECNACYEATYARAKRLEQA